MVIIILKTILNEKVGHHFCQVTVLSSAFRMRAKTPWPPQNKLCQIFAGA